MATRKKPQDLEVKVALAEQKAEASHKRLDSLNTLVKDELKEISKCFKENSDKLDEVFGFMNRSKGWAAAAVIIFVPLCFMVINLWIKYVLNAK